MKWTLILATAMLWASSSANTAPKVGVMSPAMATRQAIMRYFATDLVDSQSARWLWPRQRGTRVYCGWVNAKNKLGGYAGWTSYQITFKTGKIADGLILSDNVEANSALANECIEDGYDLSGPPRQ